MSDPHRVTSSDRATRPLFAGVDVGGTNIKLGIVDNLGKSLIQKSIPTDEERGPDDAMRRVARVLEQMMREAGVDAQEVVAVGLATPGTMDIARGMLLQPHNLPHWWEFGIQDYLRQVCHKPVSFANDANAAAFGEYWVGSGTEYHSIVLFTLGTGVGGGIIIGDFSLDGENSHGGELGHVIIDCNDTARMCGCGQRGHLEAYANARGVVQRALEELERRPASTLGARLREEGELTPLMVAQEAEAGDAAARHVVLETAALLGNWRRERDAHGGSGGGDLRRCDDVWWPRLAAWPRVPRTDPAGDSAARISSIGRAHSRRFCFARRRRGLHWGGGDCAGRLQADGPVILLRTDAETVAGGPVAGQQPRFLSTVKPTSSDGDVDECRG